MHLSSVSKVELRLIALNAELQVFHSFFDNNVPNLHVDCVEQVNFIGSRQMVELALKLKQVHVFKVIRMQILKVGFRDLVFIVVDFTKNNLLQVCVAVSGYCLETNNTENPHVRSDCTTIRGGTVSGRPPTGKGLLMSEGNAIRGKCSDNLDVANALAQLFLGSGKSFRGIAQSGYGVSCLSSSGIGFNQSGCSDREADFFLEELDGSSLVSEVFQAEDV
nr:hypothetical protein [Tanacetum cinerariifolium]